MQAEPLFAGREFDDEELSGFARRRDSAIQRSQDSGALTDWSGSRGSPTRQSCDSLETEPEPAKYVTVLSVNGGLDSPAKDETDEADEADETDETDETGFVTVLSIGRQSEGSSVCLSLAGFAEEVVRIPRKPGQKLGFGLKFDGGVEPETPVRRLFVQCCAESSPAAAVRCSWGRLVEADEIVEIDGADVRDSLGRAQVVHKLTDGHEVLTLKIRHYWDDGQRNEIMERLSGGGQRAETKPPQRKSPAPHHERAVDVPDELLRQSGRSGPATRDDPPPPVPPPRRRKPKPPVARSLSSDHVLAAGQRSVVSVPSKPPRKLQQSLSFVERTPVEASSFLLVAPEPAQVYVNIVAEEDKRLLPDTEPESDTSVSTVVDARSVSAPFCELPEIREYREQPTGFARDPASTELEPAPDAALALLIQPPETFLDREPSSVSPNSDGQQDASSDSGASSGGSELQLAESDEELRFFQQMESAVESGEDCDAILWPLVEQQQERANAASPGGVEAHREPEKQGNVEKVEQQQEQKKQASRLPRSRIPQAVSSSRPNVGHQAAKTAAGVNSRVARVHNNRSASGTSAAKSVTVGSNNAPANRRIGASAAAKPAGKPASNLLKSVKPGLGSQQQQQQQQQPQQQQPSSKIPRPQQQKSTGPAQLARPAVRHPASMSRPKPTTPAAAAKSPSRAHLTHANKGEPALGSDLVSAR